MTFLRFGTVLSLLLLLLQRRGMVESRVFGGNGAQLRLMLAISWLVPMRRPVLSSALLLVEARDPRKIEELFENGGASRRGEQWLLAC